MVTLLNNCCNLRSRVNFSLKVSDNMDIVPIKKKCESDTRPTPFAKNATNLPCGETVESVADYMTKRNFHLNKGDLLFIQC